MDTRVTMKVHTREVMAAIASAAFKKITEAADEVRNTALETLSGGRTGRQYYVPGTHRKYTASAPGEAPAVATGELRQSVRTSVETENKTVIGKVGTDKIQGKMTEFGTRNMAPRPWLRPSFEKAEGKVKAILGSRWFE